MNTINDIDDNDIRVIGRSPNAAKRKKRKRRIRLILLVVASVLVAAAVAALIWFFLMRQPRQESLDDDYTGYTENVEPDSPESGITNEPAADEGLADSIATPLSVKPGFVEIQDTTVVETPLRIFRPRYLTPSLHVGADILSDTTAAFVVQAADIRRDNGGIVGAYVLEGQLLSKGQRKSGFCAIIAGNPIIGVADATPYLEHAIETNGYFFRQYPLVVSNQIVENKPPGEALRKALAELNGEVCVIMSVNRISLHDFSQSLVDLGVSNAISLVGSKSYGFARDDEHRLITFGRQMENPAENVNYIVWR